MFRSAPIVFAVVLGFLINAWREDVLAQRRGEAALERIVQEITTNRGELVRLSAYHGALADSLAALMDDPPEAALVDTLINVSSGLGSLSISDTARETAVSRDSLSEIEFETVQDIARVYTLGERGVESSWTELAGLFTDADTYVPDADGTSLRRLHTIVASLASHEDCLIADYDALLERLDAAPVD